MGLAGRLAYSYDDKYFVEGNFGYNGSENFAKGHRFGFFPSGAAGWVISNEDFMSNQNSAITLLKLKGSIGQSGNDKIGGGRRFVYLSTINGAYGSNWGTSNTNIGGMFPPFVGITSYRVMAYLAPRIASLCFVMLCLHYIYCFSPSSLR